MKLKVKKLHESAIIPKYQTKGSAGFDLHALFGITLLPNSKALIGTGLAFNIPEGYELQIRPRSGLSLNTSLRIANAPGTIDSDYTYEVKIILENIDDKSVFNVRDGDRIAQAVLAPVIQAEIEEFDELDLTSRGGFGSTGK